MELATARQREIVAAARELLVSEGVEAVTVGRIANALGIKPPSLYKHFAGKHEIETALIAEGLDAQAEALEAARGDLVALAAAYRGWAVANPQLYRLITDRPPSRELAALEARVTAQLTRAAGDRDLARAFWAFLHGMVQLELSGRFPPWVNVSASWGKALIAFGTDAGKMKAP